jgi:hypothetical protein
MRAFGGDNGAEWLHMCVQGDPSAAPYAVENAKAILGKKPVFGICMGHQLLGQAFGGKTFKLLFGHHGGNHPIRDVASGKVQISAQNHNFAVDPDTLPEGVIVSHVNLNDGAPLPLCLPLLHETTRTAFFRVLLDFCTPCLIGNVHVLVWY